MPVPAEADDPLLRRRIRQPQARSKSQRGAEVGFLSSQGYALREFLSSALTTLIGRRRLRAGFCHPLVAIRRRRQRRRGGRRCLRRRYENATTPRRATHTARCVQKQVSSLGWLDDDIDDDEKTTSLAYTTIKIKLTNATGEKSTGRKNDARFKIRSPKEGRVFEFPARIFGLIAVWGSAAR